MRAAVHDLIPLFAEQLSIQLLMAVLICPICLEAHTGAHTNTHTKTHAKKHHQTSCLTFLLNLSDSLSFSRKCATDAYVHKQTVSLSCCSSSSLSSIHTHTHKNTRTPPRLIAAVMGRVSSNGTHKCPGEKAVG